MESPGPDRFFLLLTIVTAIFDFPWYWNQGVVWASGAVGYNISVIRILETPYRLGFDLQGGTYLVYEAGMS